VVEKDGTTGLSFGNLDKKHGWNTIPSSTVIFNNAKVPKENLLGKKGSGLDIVIAIRL
jgi:alkylation response protein AidB-like acyl-CoA dehydrogenase